MIKLKDLLTEGKISSDIDRIAKKFDIKFVGNVSSEDKLDKMGMRYQDRSAVVGVVDGEYWWSIWRRS